MKKKQIISYIVYSSIALVLFLIGMAGGNISAAEDLKRVMHILSDAFLFPAVAIGGVGAMSYIAGEGTFDMLGYAFSTLTNRFIHPGSKPESFLEYKLRKDEDRNGWLLEALVVGLVCFAASVICLAVYMCI